MFLFDDEVKESLRDVHAVALYGFFFSIAEHHLSLLRWEYHKDDKYRRRRVGMTTVMVLRRAIPLGFSICISSPYYASASSTVSTYLPSAGNENKKADLELYTYVSVIVGVAARGYLCLKSRLASCGLIAHLSRRGENKLQLYIYIICLRKADKKTTRW